MLLAFFLYVDANTGTMGDEAILAGPNWELYEGLVKCISFYYMIEVRIR